MGAGCCKPAPAGGNTDVFSTRVKTKDLRKPRWRSDEPLTESKLKAMREEFWDTEPHYGGDRVIWDALRAACEADIATARTIIDSAGIIVSADDMSICYDERGRKYELPQYVLSDPSNLVKEKHHGSSKRRSSSGGGSGQVELPVSGAAAAAGS